VRDSTRQWRSGLLVPLFIFTVVDASFLFTEARWPGDPMWTLDWAHGGLFIAGPVLAGISAVATAPYIHRSGRQMLGAGDEVRSARLVIFALGRALIVGIIGHVVVVVAAIIVNATTGAAPDYNGAYGLSFIPITMLYVAIGGIAALAMPRLLAAVVATLGSLILSYLGLYGLVPNIFEIGGHVGSLVGYEYNWARIARVLAVTLAIASACIALLVAELRSKDRVALTSSAVALLVVAFGYGVTSSSMHEPRTLLSPDIPMQECDVSEEPHVCLNVGHTASLTTVAAEFRRALEPIIASGAEVPGVYRERPPERVVPAIDGVVDLLPGSLNSARYSDSQWVHAVLVPADCAVLHADTPPGGLLETQAVLAGWLFFERTGSLDYWPLPDEALNSVTSDWVREAYGALARCETQVDMVSGLARG